MQPIFGAAMRLSRPARRSVPGWGHHPDALPRWGVIAKKHGGGDEIENLAFACNQCNLHKGTNLSGIDPVSESTIELFHPRRDSWTEHFTFQGAMVVGLTALGRATVRVLNMNDADRIRVRAELGFPDHLQ